MNWGTSLRSFGKSAVQKAASVAKSAADAASQRLAQVAEPSTTRPQKVTSDVIEITRVEVRLDPEQVVARRRIQTTDSKPEKSRPQFPTATSPSRYSTPFNCLVKEDGQHSGWIARTLVRPVERFFKIVVRMAVLSVLTVVGTVMGIVILAAAPSWFRPHMGAADSPTSATVGSQVIEAPAVAPITVQLQTGLQTKETAPLPALSRLNESAIPISRPTLSENRPHQETFAERVYESVTGKEVVHRRDGSTYERNQPGRGPEPTDSPQTGSIPVNVEHMIPSAGRGSIVKESPTEKESVLRTRKEIVQPKDESTVERNLWGLGAKGSGKNGSFKESEAEKAYEKRTGKEVVHRKDGTTYERKQRSTK